MACKCCARRRKAHVQAEESRSVASIFGTSAGGPQPESAKVHGSTPGDEARHDSKHDTASKDWQIPRETSCNLLEEGHYVVTPSKGRTKVSFSSGLLDAETPLKDARKDSCNTPETTFGGRSVAKVVQDQRVQDVISAAVQDGAMRCAPEDVAAILQELGMLCKQVRIFDANDTLGRLEKAQGTLGDDQQFDGGVSVAQLRLVQQRFQDSIARTLGPAMRKDVKWSRVAVSEKKIRANFKLEFGIRFAEGSEIDPHGPKSQVIGCAQMTNYPLTFTQYAALLVEADLLPKEWVKDCEAIEAQTGKAAKLQGTCVSTHCRPSLLPAFTFNELILRSFSLCQEPPLDALNGKAPCATLAEADTAESTSPSPIIGGLLVAEVSPPGSEKYFDGWDLPHHKKRAIRLAGLNKVCWLTQSRSDEDCCNLLVGVRLGLPLPHWMLPMDLLTRLTADLFTDSLCRIKEGCADHWSELKYDSRITDQPEFYDAVREIQKRALAGAV